MLQVSWSSSITVTFLKCPACFRILGILRSLPYSILPISTQGRVSPQVAMVEPTFAWKSISRAQVLTNTFHYHLLELLVTVILGWCHLWHLRTLWEVAPNNSLMDSVSGLCWCYWLYQPWCLFCKTEEFFFTQGPASKHCYLGDNWPVCIRYTRLIQLDMFSSLHWLGNYWNQMHILQVIVLATWGHAWIFVCEPHSYFLLSFFSLYFPIALMVSSMILNLYESL